MPVPYDVKRTGDEIIDRNLDAIKRCLDEIISSLYVPKLLSFITSGVNGTGQVALVPPKMPNGSTPLYRALVGMKVIAAIDLTNLTNLITSFENTISSSDNIRQLNSTNLSAATLLFIVQG